MKKTLCITWILICLPLAIICAQNAPVTRMGSGATVGSNFSLPVTAENFSNIASCNLKMTYDSTIARATAIVTGSLPGGTLVSNLSVPGIISIGWYAFPGVTLTGNPVLFSIVFTKISDGTTPVSWDDDGFSCVYYDGSYNRLNDLPASTYYTDGTLTFLPPVAPVVTLPALTGCKGANTIDVPVYAAGFNDVGKFILTMYYGTSAMTYQSFTNNAGFPVLSIDGSIPGTIIATGIVTGGILGITLPDNAILFTLHFTYSGWSTSLAWSELSAACQFAGPPPVYNELTDLPQQVHYVNGSVTPVSLPAAAAIITGPPGGYVRRGEGNVTFQTTAIEGATAYAWTVPEGIDITSGENTRSITVSVGNTFTNGSLFVQGENICGKGSSSPMFLLKDTTALGISIPGTGTANDQTSLALKAFPNPFSGSVNLNWFLPREGNVLIEIMNMSGERVATVQEHFEQAGNESLQLADSGLRPGIYSVRIVLKAGNKLMSKAIKIVCND